MERIEVNVITGEKKVIQLTPEEIAEIENRPSLAPTLEQQRVARQSAYATEADPLYFKSQRGESTLEEWQTKIDEIRARYPYPS